MSRAVLAACAPLLDPYSTSDLPARMAARIMVDPLHGCWIGSAPLNRDGYAKWSGTGLHRAVWQELVGPIGPGLVLDHREDWGCTSRACCWPMHLLETSHRVNVLRGRSFAAVNARKERCDNDHPFDTANTYWRPNGHRDCRACIRVRVARYQRRIRHGAAELGQAA